ncbi:hypothetical protein HGB48_35945 [Actinomadura latina]|uniref:Mutator family transposase n=1 Tax=Actinomadura latina TaxID=163603 RepID=A0A846ZG17_9ACTN|nr:transposase [Actinomadura latina]NKZ09096.1 hypothetical protein [Actinomadura latina]
MSLVGPDGLLAGINKTVLQAALEAEMRDLRQIYTAPTEAAAQQRFAEFEAEWGDRYPAIIRLWRDAWPTFTPFLAFLAEIRKVVYTTNAIWVLYLPGRSRSCSLDRRSNRLALTLNAMDREVVSDSKCRAGRVSADPRHLA